MNLKFNLEVQDWMDFHQYHLLNNMQYKKTKALITYIVPIVFGVYLYYKFQNDELVMETGLMVVFMCAIWVLFYPKRLDKKALGRAQASIEKESSESLGINEVLISDNEIKHEHPGTQVTYEWRSIREVIETESSIFIYATAASPIIVPKNKIDETELKGLVAVLNAKGFL
ncbi:MAG: YcxB family protein [Cyclobacteriaceae bacterium]